MLAASLYLLIKKTHEVSFQAKSSASFITLRGKNMKKTNLVDTPIRSRRSDRLDVSLYVEALQEFLLEADTPLTIAIQGEWGSGKTSFMNQLSEGFCTDQRMLERESAEAPYFGIWIHAWEYALLKDPSEILFSLLNGIIHEIYSEVKRVSPHESNVRKYCKDALTITKKLALATICAAASQVNINTDSVQKVITESFNATDDASIGKLKRELQKVISASCSSAPQKKGFIFFIDDLDRLDPVIAVNFLELVKNIFDLQNCIFVLAIDYEVVVRGLTPRFGERTEKNEREFRSFFDKIIQVPFSVPVAAYNMKRYLKESLYGIDFLRNDEKDTAIPLDHSVDYIHEADIPSRSASALNILASITEHSIGGNPRSIKRLMNTLSLLCKIQYRQNSLQTVTEKLIMYSLVSIHIAFPDIYKFLSYAPGFLFWNKEYADSNGIPNLNTDTSAVFSEGDFDEDFEKVIYRLCQNDSYYKANCINISRLFNIIRGIILCSDHKNIFGSDDIEGIELLHKYDFCKLYDKDLLKALDSEDLENSEEDEDPAEEGSEEPDLNIPDNSEEWNKALAAMAFLIERAISKFLYMSSTTAIEAAPVRTPEANTAARKRREYTKSDTFDSFEEYAEGLNESYLKLFEELRDFLEDDFPAMLEFEFKDDFTNTINIRPVNKKKRKGIPAPLLAITTLKKKKGATMRVRCGDRFSLDLTDSVEQVLGHAQDIRERFLELSSDSLRNDSPK